VDSPTAPSPIAATAEPKASRHAWYTLIILTLIYTCNAIDRGVINVVLEPLRKEFALSDTQLGMLGGLAFGITTALAGVPIGYLIDRLNRVNILSGLVVIWSGLTALTGFSQSYAHLLAARMAVGLFEGGASPTIMSLISDRFPRAQRSSAVSLMFLAHPIGNGAVFIMGALVVAQFGWRGAFFIAGLPGIILALLAYFTVKEPVRGAMEVGSTPAVAARTYSVRETARFALSQPAFLHVLAGIIITALMTASLAVWIMSLLIRVHGLTTIHAGFVVGFAVVACGMLGTTIGGFLSDRLAKRNTVWLAWVPAIACTVAGALGVGVGLAPSMLLLLPLLVGFEVIANMYKGPGYGLALSLMKPNMRGLSMSTVQMCANLLGAGFGPFLLGMLSDAYGGPNSLQPAIATMTLAGLWAGLHFFLAGRTLEKGLQRAGEA